MFDISTLSVAIVSLVLLVAAAAMMHAHLRAWRKHQRQELDAEELDYRRRQFRRRMQTSAMLGALGIALFVGHVLIDRLDSGWFAIAFWGAAMLWVCWIGLLALVDIGATRRHFDRQNHQAFLEEIVSARDKDRRINNCRN